MFIVTCVRTPCGQMHFEMCQILIWPLSSIRVRVAAEDTIVSHGIRMLEHFIALRAHVASVRHINI